MRIQQIKVITGSMVVLLGVAVGLLYLAGQGMRTYPIFSVQSPEQGIEHVLRNCQRSDYVQAGRFIIDAHLLGQQDREEFAIVMNRICFGASAANFRVIDRTHTWTGNAALVVEMYDDAQELLGRSTWSFERGGRSWFITRVDS